MTIQEIAEREEVSERQVQRYVREGFQGHVLKATKVGKAYHVEEGDYCQWRIDCGFEQPDTVKESLTAPSSPDDEHPAPDANLAARPASAANLAALPPYPPYPLPADPNGVPTNAPHPHSSTWPHPLACEDYMRSEAAKLIAKYQGAPHVED